MSKTPAWARATAVFIVLFLDALLAMLFWRWVFVMHFNAPNISYWQWIGIILLVESVLGTRRSFSILNNIADELRGR